MKSSRNRCDVVVLGAGIAAAAAAIRLCALGFRPLIVARVHKVNQGVEAIPSAALALVSDFGLENALREAGAMLVGRFENHWASDEARVQSGEWIQVERSRFAASAIREAVKRGACFRVSETNPTFHQDDECVRVSINSSQFDFYAGIDATGRTAVQSRPIGRAGRQVADVYEVSQEARHLPSKIVRLPFGWGYSMATYDHRSIAVLFDDGKNRPLPFSAIERTFAVSKELVHYIGRRPAFVQWSENPINGRVIAVGDAALAYDPLAGQGIRFALSSAIAASSVIKTWSRSVSSSAANRFYRSFVARSRDAHLRFLERWRSRSDAPEQQGTLAVPRSLIFSDQITEVELHRNDVIAPGVAFRLPDGDSARWVGGVDLIELRNSAPAPVSSTDLLNRFRESSGDWIQAGLLLQWCLRHQVLRSAL